MTVALTQSEGRLEGLEELLQERGFAVTRSPLIETLPILSDAVREQLHTLLELPWVLFTSPAAAYAWQRLELPFRAAGPRFGAVGRQTAEAINRRGGEVAILGSPQTAQGLAGAFLRHPQAAGPVGLPRGARALPTLEGILRKRGFDTRPVVVYRTVARSWPGGEADVVVLASPSAVAALPEAVGRSCRLVTLGKTTQRAAARRGWQAEVPASPQVADVLAAVERLVR